MLTTKDIAAEVERRRLRAVSDDVPTMHRPTKEQFFTWEKMVDWSLDADPDGYFLGWCPIPKVDGNPAHRAMYSFFKGVVRCEEGCFNSRTASMSNVLTAIAVQTLRA